MRQLRLPIFTSKIKYYNLRIVPPGTVFDQVNGFKKEFESEYGKQPLSGSKPHITLASFKMNSKYQDLLIEVFNKLGQKKAFELKIDGFDVFEASKTLCLAVSGNKELKEMHEEIKHLHKEGLKGKLKSFFVSDNPHITISKASGRKMLFESLQYFQRNRYTEQIGVNHLTLVSRAKYRSWDWTHEIELSK